MTEALRRYILGKNQKKKMTEEFNPIKELMEATEEKISEEDLERCRFLAALMTLSNALDNEKENKYFPTFPRLVQK